MYTFCYKDEFVKFETRNDLMEFIQGHIGAYPDELTEVSCKVTGLGLYKFLKHVLSEEDKITAIKYLRLLTSETYESQLGLKEAKDIVELVNEFEPLGIFAY